MLATVVRTLLDYFGRDCGRTSSHPGGPPQALFSFPMVTADSPGSRTVDWFRCGTEWHPRVSFTMKRLGGKSVWFFLRPAWCNINVLGDLAQGRRLPWKISFAVGYLSCLTLPGCLFFSHNRRSSRSFAVHCICKLSALSASRPQTRHWANAATAVTGPWAIGRHQMLTPNKHSVCWKRTC